MGNSACTDKHFWPTIILVIVSRIRSKVWSSQHIILTTKKTGVSNHQWKIWLWFYYFQSSNKTSVLFALLHFKWLLPYYVSEDIRSESLFYDQKYPFWETSGQPNLLSLFIFIFILHGRGVATVIKQWWLIFFIIGSWGMERMMTKFWQNHRGDCLMTPLFELYCYLCVIALWGDPFRDQDT